MASGLRPARIARLIFGALLVSSTSLAGPLDPMQFQSLGNLSLNAPGTYVVNTTGPNPTLLAGGNVYTGVVFNGVAVFDFNSVSISSGATLMAIGGNPVALLSRSTENISGSINVSASRYDSRGRGQQYRGWRWGAIWVQRRVRRGRRGLRRSGRSGRRLRVH